MRGWGREERRERWISGSGWYKSLKYARFLHTKYHLKHGDTTCLLTDEGPQAVASNAAVQPQTSRQSHAPTALGTRNVGEQVATTPALLHLLDNAAQLCACVCDL